MIMSVEDIKEVKAEYDKEIQNQNTNDSDLSDAHEGSKLFQQDVTNTDTLTKNIESACDSAYSECSACASAASSSTSTIIKDCEGPLVSIGSEIESAKSKIPVILQNIKDSTIKKY